MKKALIITTVSGFLPQFEMNNVKLLQMDGYEVHYAANYNNPVYGDDNSRLDNTGIIRHQIDFVRSPFRIVKHIKAYIQLKRLMKEYKFDLVHCHTPVGGAIGRLSAKAVNVDYIIYTAHGFHFYNGASFLRWALFYPVERMLAYYTDTLITINKEDYKRAKSFRLRDGGKVEYIPGIGIKTGNYNKNIVSKEKKFQELGLSNRRIILTSVGELSARKNHSAVIRAIAKIKEENILYLICGSGRKERKLRKLVNKLGIENKVIFLGYRKDVEEILAISDVFIFPSKQEGLPVAVMEAMAAGRPIICSKIRGNTDLVQDGIGGYLVEADDIEGYVKAIQSMLRCKEEKRNNMGSINVEKIKQFDLEQVEKAMVSIYHITKGKSSEDKQNINNSKVI